MSAHRRAHPARKDAPRGGRGRAPAKGGLGHKKAQGARGRKGTRLGLATSRHDQADLIAWLARYRDVDAVAAVDPNARQRQRATNALLKDRRLSVVLEGALRFPDDGLVSLARTLRGPTNATAEDGDGVARRDLVRPVLLSLVHGAPLVLDDAEDLDALGTLAAYRRDKPGRVIADELRSPFVRTAARAIGASLGHAELAYETLRELAGGRSGRRGAHLGKLERLAEARAKDAAKDAERRFERFSGTSVVYVDLLPLVVKRLGDEDVVGLFRNPYTFLALGLGCVLCLGNTGRVSQSSPGSGAEHPDEDADDHA